MPTELNIEISPGDLAQIVKSVFETMVNLDVDQCGAPWFPRGDRLTSAVHLAGDWNGALLLECDPRQACSFAARFLSVEPADTANDDVRDVLGELANMIGGNLKCVLSHGLAGSVGEDIRLSMPSVVDGGDYALRVCGATVRARLTFQCVEGLFWITVLSADPEQESNSQRRAAP